jgi:predicted nucleotidyltransferase
LRGEQLSVWAFEEIYAASLPLGLPRNYSIQIPTVPGYAAAKLGAWLDRSAYGEFKDATDLALVLHWYDESATISDRLYDTDAGQAILQQHGFDAQLASTHLLGNDIATVIGHDRQTELLIRWPGDLPVLTRELHTSLETTSTINSRWPRPERIPLIINALSRGLVGKL